MAYKYDPILCMMVEDKSTNTRDVALPVMQDAIQFVQLRFSSGRTEGAKLDESEYREYAESLLKLYGEKQVTISKNGKVIVTYINRRSNDSLSKATRMCKLKDAETTRDGMFSKTFSKYTNDARWKVQQGLSELSKVNDKKQVDPVSQAYVKELNKIIVSIDEAFNVAASDYKAERDKIIEIINQFNKDSFNIYKAMDAAAGVALKILSNSKALHAKYLAMTEKESDPDMLSRIANKTVNDFDDLLDDFDKMPDMFQRQFAEVRKLVSKHKLDLIKAQSKKFKALERR